jgi:hypothetical protein
VIFKISNEVEGFFFSAGQDNTLLDGQQLIQNQLVFLILCTTFMVEVNE